MSKRKPKRQKPHPQWQGIELRWALGGSDFEAAANLLEEDPSILDADAYGSESALQFWSVENRADIVEWLLKRGANPNRVSENGAMGVRRRRSTKRAAWGV